MELHAWPVSIDQLRWKEPLKWQSRSHKLQTRYRNTQRPHLLIQRQTQLMLRTLVRCSDTVKDLVLAVENCIRVLQLGCLQLMHFVSFVEISRIWQTFCEFSTVSARVLGLYPSGLCLLHFPVPFPVPEFLLKILLFAWTCQIKHTCAELQNVNQLNMYTKYSFVGTNTAGDKALWLLCLKTKNAHDTCMSGTH